MIKQWLASMFARAGYTVIPTWQLPLREIVTDLRRRFAAFDIDLVLDVGANTGQFRDMLRDRVGYKGQIESFEPIPDLAAMLTSRASADPAWAVHHLALGSEAGQAGFNIMASSEFSSLLAPRAGEGALFERHNEVQRRVTVDVQTLDQILPPLVQKHNPKGVFIKIDTQGFDLEVLRGGRNVLSRVSALQTEASVHRIYENAPGYHEVMEFMHAIGFTASAILPNNDGHFPRLVEFDFHFVRTDLVEQMEQRARR